MRQGIFKSSYVFKTKEIITIRSIQIKTKKTNYNKIYIKKLKNIKLDNTSIKNTKKLAYEITYYINKISLDKNSIDIKNQLLENLDNYKYKKEIIKLDQNTRILYKKILENI